LFTHCLSEEIEQNARRIVSIGVSLLYIVPFFWCIYEQFGERDLVRFFKLSFPVFGAVLCYFVYSTISSYTMHAADLFRMRADLGQRWPMVLFFYRYFTRVLEKHLGVAYRLCSQLSMVIATILGIVSLTRSIMIQIAVSLWMLLIASGARKGLKYTVVAIGCLYCMYHFGGEASGPSSTLLAVELRRFRPLRRVFLKRVLRTLG